MTPVLILHCLLIIILQYCATIIVIINNMGNVYQNFISFSNQISTCYANNQSKYALQSITIYLLSKSTLRSTRLSCLPIHAYSSCLIRFESVRGRKQLCQSKGLLRLLGYYVIMSSFSLADQN